jgi:hypothetical protein
MDPALPTVPPAPVEPTDPPCPTVPGPPSPPDPADRQLEVSRAEIMIQLQVLSRLIPTNCRGAIRIA